MKSVRSGLKRLPLFFKLFIPFLALVVVVGSAGALLIVKGSSSRAQSRLDQDLLQSSLSARAKLHDRELYLLESVNFAANLQGMADALASNERSAVAGLLESVLALKSDLSLVAVTDREGNGVVEFARSAPDEPPRPGAGTDWSAHTFIDRALRDPNVDRSAGFLELGGQRVLAIAGAFCSGPDPCAPVGGVIIGMPIDRLLDEASDANVVGGTAAGLAIYDRSGHVLAARGDVPEHASGVRFSADRVIRRNERIAATDLSSLYAPFRVQGRTEGIVAVSMSRAAAFAPVRQDATRLALILLAVMAGIVAIGALLAKVILAQVRPLLETNRALGAGDLTARAPIVTDDELGELARGVNQMAAQLEASYETLESRVTQRTEEVQRLVQERTEFFTGISHEFRTPLAVIISQAELMLDPTYPRRGRWTEEIGGIRESAQQLLVLINDILEVARSEAGQIELQFGDVSVPEVISALRPTAAGLAAAGGLDLCIDVAASLPMVRADAFRLREVVLNVIDNATKYTPAGGRVDVRAAANGSAVKIAISDTGMGIPDGVGERIFEPFYRVAGTEPQRGQGASGLGLALAKRLIEAQGGTISFVSEPDVGTTFTVTVPVAHQPVAGRARPKGQTPAAAGRTRRPQAE